MASADEHLQTAENLLQQPIAARSAEMQFQVIANSLIAIGKYLQKIISAEAPWLNADAPTPDDLRSIGLEDFGRDCL